MSHLRSHRHSWRRLHRGATQKFFARGGAKVLLPLGAMAALVGSIGILGTLAFVSRDLPNPNSLSERSVSQSTKIYDRTGEHLLYEIHGEENRTLVKLAEPFCGTGDKLTLDSNGIPLMAVQATIAAEDRLFCEHYGFSLKGIGRALLANLRGDRQGGSTLTQQLVKQAILSGEKKLSRKIKELILSIEIERRYSKDEILQIYFNEIPYGSTNYGIQSAAQHYFQKDVKDLALAEAATLAALPQRPTTLLNNPDLLLARRNWILDGMQELGFITSEQKDQAKTEAITLQPQISNITAPHFVFYVKQLLEDEEGFSQREIEEGGLKVTTTLDFDKQKIAEEEIKKGVEDRGERYQFTNGSLVAMDPKTGQVLAMVGSKDYFDDAIDGQVNVALRPRQPGSSFKPIVYTAGFIKGYTPNTIIWDVKTDFPTATSTYSPNDYDGKQRGPLTVRSALQGSLNIPAVEMVYLVGVENALTFAEQLGYSTFKDRSRFGLAIVLGGAEVKLLEHTNAFATLADEGVYHEPVAVLKIEDASGTVLKEWKPGSGKRVVEENVAHMTANVLSDNAARAYIFGSQSSLQLGSRPVAAKTGTTNDYHDAWTMGYTPSLAVGVWVGNNNNDAMVRGADGSIIAAPIWNGFLRRALENQPVESFTPPQIPIRDKAILNGSMPKQTVTIDTASGKLATEYTPASFREEKTFAEYHSILQYVDKNDPLGPTPAHPSDDPYYEPWEKAIRIWIAAMEASTGILLEQGNAPTEYDDLHVPENFPSVAIESPGQDDEFHERTIAVRVNATAPRGVRRVEFYLDGYYLGSDQNAPYELETSIPNTIGRGYHTLKTVAYDDIDNTGSDSVGIRLLSNGEAASFEIMDPKNGQTIERIQDTFTVVLSLNDPEEYRAVRLYAEKIGGAGPEFVGSVEQPESPFITIAWTLPADGDWALSATAESQNGKTLETPGIVVHVEPAASTSSSQQTTTSSEQTGEESAPTTDDASSTDQIDETIDNLNPFEETNSL